MDTRPFSTGTLASKAEIHSFVSLVKASICVKINHFTDIIASPMRIDTQMMRSVLSHSRRVRRAREQYETILKEQSRSQRTIILFG